MVCGWSASNGCFRGRTSRVIGTEVPRGVAARPCAGTLRAESLKVAPLVRRPDWEGGGHDGKDPSPGSGRRDNGQEDNYGRPRARRLAEGGAPAEDRGCVPVRRSPRAGIPAGGHARRPFGGSLLDAAVPAVRGPVHRDLV